MPSSGVTGPKSDDLHPAVRGLLSALDELLSELERASSAVPASPKNERERYIRILVALSKFVHRVGSPQSRHIQSRHILELAQLLEDLDRGIVGSALESTFFGQGRTGDSSPVWEARGRVAMGLEALIRLGASRKEAAKSALRDFPSIGRLMTAKSKNSVDAMLSWHDEFLRWKAGRSRSKNSYLASTFDLGVELLEECVGSSDLQKRERLLRRFAQSHFKLASRI
jgi:hypothetical protein